MDNRHVRPARLQLERPRNRMAHSWEIVIKGFLGPT